MNARIPAGVGILILLSFPLMLLGCVFPFEGMFFLGIGWAFFLARVIPQVAVSPAGVTTGVVGLTLFAAGLHWLLVWCYDAGALTEESRTAPRRWKARWTGVIVALVVLTFTAGIAAVGMTHQVGWLLTSPGPLMTRGSIRDAAARTRSQNNLKQLALGLHNFNDATNGRLPPGYTTDAAGQPLHGWQAQILPYVEQESLHRLIRFDRPWDDPVNRAALQTDVKVFRVPLERLEHDADGYFLTHYAGNVRVFPAGHGLSLPRDFTDGTSNTILLGEVTAGYRPWGHPLNLRDPARGLGDVPDRFGGHYPNSVLFAMADGSVHIVSQTVSPATLKAAATPAGNDQLGPDW